MILLLIEILDFIQGSLPLKWLGVRKPREEAFRKSSWKSLPKPQKTSNWFHASSLGELEMLRPLIDDFIERGELVCVSVFSDSALPGLRDLESRCLYVGFSPREKEWLPLFEHFRVKKLILAKYDFWPGMIRSSAFRNVPVLVINARLRRSFLWMRALFAFQKFPVFYLFGSDEKERTLNGLRIHSGVDPRWERVARRANQEASHAEKKERILYWREQIARLPRPLGVIGSAWPEDLEMLLPALEGFKGAIVIVPHSLANETLARIQSQVAIARNCKIVVISEVGILVEIYAEADFAFVGGGFGKGIHSVIEPAAFGIPVASGPARVRDFSETSELRDAGILTVLRNPLEISQWLGSISPHDSGSGLLDRKRNRYRALLEECLRIR
ncbi:MAG: hypothetical protein KGP28_04050 [Bdellovibrionales bacterium]|nr:hypothetical protein [Bdellovibrionales bacterium]